MFGLVHCYYLAQELFQLVCDLRSVKYISLSGILLQITASFHLGNRFAVTYSVFVFIKKISLTVICADVFPTPHAFITAHIWTWGEANHTFTRFGF